ncbi:hypothetical protein ACH5RR_018203 [Cinchona calisaya]|uniref:Pentatricopeptide repeat-containing protein n=1 Tax=Cinchona calisaya TaxID=153742 RepID=A0ABD2ZLN9_9GENT
MYLLVYHMSGDTFSQRLKMDVITYRSLVFVFCKEAKISSAFQVRDDMLENGIAPGIGVYNAIMEAMFRRRKVWEIVLLLKEMSREGCELNVVSFEILKCALLKCQREGFSEAAKLLKDAPVLMGSALVSRKMSHFASDIPSSVAYEVMMSNKEAGAVAAFDHVADLYAIRANLVDGGEIHGTGNAWICPEGEVDDSGMDVNFSGNLFFDKLMHHYIPGLKLDQLMLAPQLAGVLSVTNGESRSYLFVSNPQVCSG